MATIYKGTNVVIGNKKRTTINTMIDVLKKNGYVEISMPIIQFQKTFAGKVGKENNNLMFNFTDRAGREICLAPEYTAVIQKLELEPQDLFYVQECFRGEKPQKGRYRQFTQLGVERITPNPEELLHQTIAIAEMLVELITYDYETVLNVSRGLDYYKKGQGFEIICSELGSAKQICGGGIYEGGVGFAIGIDRLLLLNT